MPTSSDCQPPCTITTAVLSLLAETRPIIAHGGALSARSPTPYPRRGSRIRAVQASLAIENNRRLTSPSSAGVRPRARGDWSEAADA